MRPRRRMALLGGEPNSSKLPEKRGLVGEENTNSRAYLQEIRI
jgi:hypothetical protein